MRSLLRPPQSTNQGGCGAQTQGAEPISLGMRLPDSCSPGFALPALYANFLLPASSTKAWRYPFVFKNYLNLLKVPYHFLKTTVGCVIESHVCCWHVCPGVSNAGEDIGHLIFRGGGGGERVPSLNLKLTVLQS